MFKVNCLIGESERLKKTHNGSVDDSTNSSLSSSPSILSYSDKSSEFNEVPTPASALVTSRSTNDLSRSKSRERSTTPTTRLRHNRNKSLNDSVFVQSSQHNLKQDKDSHVKLPHNSKHKSNLICCKCNNLENVNKQNHITQMNVSNTNQNSLNSSNNTSNHKTKSKYFDTDIFLKFFFIM